MTSACISLNAVLLFTSDSLQKQSAFNRFERAHRQFGELGVFTKFELSFYLFLFFFFHFFWLFSLSLSLCCVAQKKCALARHST